MGVNAVAEDAAPRAEIGPRRLLAAVGLTGSAALLSVALGVATTKVIAMVAGPAGIAVMGLYRYAGALVSRSLLLGLDTTVVQRISTAKDPKDVSNTVGAAALALVFQGVAIAVLAGIGAGLIGAWLFGTAATRLQLVEIRVVLAMAYANLVMQVMTAVLSGRAEVRKVAWVGVAAAVVTLMAIYPLLQLGNVGLALNVGSGSTVGAALATFYVWRVYRPAWVPGSLGERFRALSAVLARSFFLIVHPIVMMSAVVSVQSLVFGRFELAGLGAYNAAMTLLDTALMVMMASARSFFLPTLGQLDGHEDKAGAVNRVLRINLILAFATTLVTIAGAPVLIRVLFSNDFATTERILPAFSLALVGQAFVWTYAMFYLHRARYRLFFSLDLFWAALYVGGTLIVTSRSGSLTAAAWVYAGSYCLSGIAYAFVAVRAFGMAMLDNANVRLGAFALLGALGACLAHELGSWQLDLAVMSFGLAILGRELRRTLSEARGETA